jgi:hypothetical protein
LPPKSTFEEDKKAQISFYEHALTEIVDRANKFFKTSLELELPELNEDVYAAMYTLDGRRVSSLMDLAADVQYLVCCINEFQPVKIDFQKWEDSKLESTTSFAQKVINKCKIKIDRDSAEPQAPLKSSLKKGHSKLSTSIL